MYAVFAAPELFAVLLIPKCGSETLRRSAMGVVETVTNVDRLAFFRDPIERFNSAHAFLSALNAAPDNYEDFVDWSFDIDDEHIMPQSDFVYQSGRKLYDYGYILSDMDSVLQSRIGYTLPRHHKSVPRKTTNYRIDEIKQRYQSDYDLIRGLHG